MIKITVHNKIENTWRMNSNNYFDIQRIVNNAEQNLMFFHQEIYIYKTKQEPKLSLVPK